MEDDIIITRAALGRLAFVGDLYDARTDNICGISVFTDTIPPSAITAQDFNFSETHTIHADSFCEKFSILGLEPELQASLLAGLFPFERSGSFLEDQRKPGHSVKSSSLLYKIVSRDESVDIFNEELINSFALDSIDGEIATHIVTGICWGANLIVSFVYKNHDKQDEEEIVDSLFSQIEALTLSISGNASPDFEAGMGGRLPYSIKIYGDILPDTVPTTFEGALQLMTELPSLISNHYNGRGMPISYQLTPIFLLQDWLNMDIPADITLITLDEAILMRVVQLFDEMADAQQKLNDFHLYASANKQSVMPQDRVKILNFKRQVSLEESSYQSKVSSILIHVRSGRMSMTELENLIQQFQTSRVSPQNIKAFIAKLKTPREHVPLARTTSQLSEETKTPAFSQPQPPSRTRSLSSEIQAGFLDRNRKFSNPRTANSPVTSPPQTYPRVARTASKPPQRQPKEVNILILGETGVGKSTWINSFINSYTHHTFQEAEASDLFNLIPSQFIVCDENFQQITVNTGNDRNEDHQTGQSATQEARVYTLQIGNRMTVRLIDTPGIGDTRGIEQDRENFQNILSTLSHLEDIHGICILLKPNNARLNVMFRFCIKELLTYLHRDASKNIVFCFTNSRGTLYRPGDTMPALVKLLQENKEVEIPVNKETVYCYDSEAYRFLAAVKNNPPVQFSEDDRENFARSWDKSFTELKKMLDYISRLAPHPIQSTLNLNHARELVLKMCRPLAEISRNIQMNKIIVEEDKMEIENMKESIEELKKKQMTTRTEIEMVKLDFPRTVCAHSRCIRIVNAENVQKVEYKTVCHDKCHQTGVPADTIGHVKLLKCSRISMLTATCKNCGHHFKQHLHIYYNSVMNVNQVENEAVKASLKENLSAAEMKQRMINEKNAWLEEYAYELSMIEQASIKFAYFLKANAITPYNDGMELYLDHLIKEEENKVACGGNRSTLDSLKLSKESYVYQKVILEEQMKMGVGSAPTTEEVDSLVKELKRLKHSGKTLQDALDCVNYAGSREYIESVVQKLPAKRGAPSMESTV